jgi:hypothetical protein
LERRSRRIRDSGVGWENEGNIQKDESEVEYYGRRDVFEEGRVRA